MTNLSYKIVSLQKHQGLVTRTPFPNATSNIAVTRVILLTIHGELSTN